jgi:aryl-alcohol dehydrogenase-like predicted oxidoreductase
MTTPLDHPRLGFGCASLGSRISRRDGIAALERAFDAGVRWYDVAPSYGDGQAESLLGEFLRGRRDQVSLCTKVGILPPRPSLPKRLLRPAVRLLLAAAPGMRAQVKKRRPAAVKPPLRAAAILPGLEASLTRLGVEHVDVLALHDATPQEVVREDVLRVLEQVLASGKAGRISIASFAPSITAGLAASPVYGVVQVANNPFQRGLARIAGHLPADRPVTTVTHTVFGATGMAERVAALIDERTDLAQAMRAAGYEGAPAEMARAYLPDYAFAANPEGVVLLSMFSGRHLESNLARHARPRDRAAILELAALLPEEP